MILSCLLLKKLADGDEGEKEKLVTATKKGAAVLDHYLPDDIKTRYHVLQQVSLFQKVFASGCKEVFALLVFSLFLILLTKKVLIQRILVDMQGNEIYDAILNQTNVGNNNNKFYIIQVLG